MLLRRDIDEERNEHIDMTPMVDVVFQLMTFMLFSIQMSGGEKVERAPGSARGRCGGIVGDIPDSDQTPDRWG